jgi:hypothetical protein
LGSCTQAQKRTKAKSQMIQYQVEVTQTADYCGGAMPTEEILKSLQTPEPIPGKTIYIKTGRVNKQGKAILKQATTDNNGRFSIALKSGQSYVFVEDWKVKPFQVPDNTDMVTWDADCLKKRYEQGDYVLDLTKTPGKERIIRINYHQVCFYKPYCGNYTGPIPP